MSEEDQKFQKLWDFRRRDNEFDSSTDDSKSKSQCEPVLKKHKLVFNVILPQEDETSYPPKNPQFDPNTGASFEFGKDNRSNVELGKKTRAIKKNKNKGSKGNTSNKGSSQDPNCIDGLKNFAKSILEDLKVEREKMFARMKEEMRDFVDVKLVSKPTRKRGGGSRKKKAGPVKKSGELGAKTSNSKNSHKVVDEKVNHEPVTPNEEIPKSSLRKLNYSPNEIVSSSFLTLPYVALSEPQRISPKNHEVNANDVNENLESKKSRNGEGGGSCYFQNQEQFGTFGQMGSKDLGFYDQQSVQTSNMSNGFAVPLHQRLDNGFTNMPTSQNIMENSTSGNILSGLRMNGSDLFANNFRGYMNPKIDGRVHAFGTQDRRDGQFHPK